VSNREKKLRISPLRFAPVEMTKGRVVMVRGRGLGLEKAQVPPLRCASAQQLNSLEAPPSPLSSRPKRSAVERSLCGYFFLEMFFEPLLELRL
jgi:hypothetical protein